LTGLLALTKGHTTVGDPKDGRHPPPDPHAPIRTPDPTDSAARVTRAAPERQRIVRRHRSHSPDRLRQPQQPACDRRHRTPRHRPRAVGLPPALRRLHPRYGSNGSDNFQRKCPRCQGGAPGQATRPAQRQRSCH
jgi:hypothetical protein